MKNFAILTQAIQYMEQGLCSPITRETVAKHCHVSLSTLEKIFGYAMRMGIKSYLERRRMTQSAKLLLQGISVTELAMEFQFQSVEVFSRSFKRVWQVNPSEFAARWKFAGIFPRIDYVYEEGEDLNMARKKVDMSESYDYLREHSGSFVLCFDVKGLLEINSISHAAGDLVILEMAARLDRAATEDMLVMRIGGDEFVLVTGFTNLKMAQAVRDAVLSENGKPVIFQGQEFPVSLWCGMTKLPEGLLLESLRYGSLFTTLHEVIAESKK